MEKWYHYIHVRLSFLEDVARARAGRSFKIFSLPKQVDPVEGQTGATVCLLLPNAVTVRARAKQ